MILFEALENDAKALSNLLKKQLSAIQSQLQLPSQSEGLIPATQSSPYPSLSVIFTE